RPARRRVDPRAYTTLRNELIAACRSLAETDGERRSYYAALEDMVRPWLSLRVLARTDREILITLLSHCRELERKVTGRRRVLEGGWWGGYARSAGRGGWWGGGWSSASSCGPSPNSAAPCSPPCATLSTRSGSPSSTPAPSRHSPWPPYSSLWPPGWRSPGQP